MFVSKIGDLLNCEHGVYEVLDQFEFEEKAYLILRTISVPFVEVITKTAPVYFAREIISEKGDEYSIDFLEDKELIEKLKRFLKE